MKKANNLAAGLLILLCGIVAAAQPPQTTRAAAFDVVHYAAHIEPNVSNKTVAGTVAIRFVATVNNLREIEFDCGVLEVRAVRENAAAQKYTVENRRLKIALSRPARRGERREITVEYRGAPTFGIRFFPERAQVYTAFSTSQWMPAVDAPSDKATFDLNLIAPADWRTVGNGELVSKTDLPHGKTAHRWRQDAPVSTYLFGFAAGRFREVVERIKVNKRFINLRYLAGDFADAELRRVFRETEAMIRFYEEKAGVPFGGKTYAQVLAAGNVAQEMSGFAAIREAYGRGVLENERHVWLGAHELAHQWWGNRVTNWDWTHFWLNEGVTNFMTAAFLERRFGRAEYLREIGNYRAAYEKVRARGLDKPLVFPDWTRPTTEDRTLVYDKGAYVLHLLREELGEAAFWTGIKNYTRKFWGATVVTRDFQKEMEAASKKDLSAFFARWVYLSEN